MKRHFTQYSANNAIFKTRNALYSLCLAPLHQLSSLPQGFYALALSLFRSLTISANSIALAVPSLIQSTRTNLFYASCVSRVLSDQTKWGFYDIPTLYSVLSNWQRFCYSPFKKYSLQFLLHLLFHSELLLTLFIYSACSCYWQSNWKWQPNI